MRLPTASSLWLAAACPASHVLPWSGEVRPEMERGTVVHRFLEQLPEAGRARALEQVPPQHRDICERIDPAQVPEGEREVAFAWSIDRGEAVRLGAGLNRAYHAPGPGRWIFGTADVCATYRTYGTAGDRWGEVLDYKVTDVPIDARGLLKPAAQSHQLRALALALARAAGVSRVEVAHLRVSSDGRIDGSDRATLGYFDLAAIEQEMHGIVARVERAAQQELPRMQSVDGGETWRPIEEPRPIDVTPGSHCEFCPAAQRCPATTALIRELAQHSLIDRWLSEPARAWEFLRRGRAALDLLDRELRAQARLWPIELGDCRVVREVEEQREEIDPAVALGVLRDAYGERQALAAVDVTKEGIKRVTGGGLAQRSILTEIRNRGGSRKVALKVVRETSPPVQAAPAADWPEDMDPLDFEALATGPKRT